MCWYYKCVIHHTEAAGHTTLLDDIRAKDLWTASFVWIFPAAGAATTTSIVDPACTYIAECMHCRI